MIWRVEHNRFCRYFESEQDARRYQGMVARGRRRVTLTEASKGPPPKAPHQAHWEKKLRAGVLTP